MVLSARARTLERTLAYCGSFDKLTRPAGTDEVAVGRNRKWTTRNRFAVEWVRLPELVPRHRPSRRGHARWWTAPRSARMRPQQGNQTSCEQPKVPSALGPTDASGRATRR